MNVMNSSILKRSGGGFTLVEVLITITIIGILVSIMTLNFLEARKVARDKIRMSALKELQVAINLYKAQNGRYPEVGCSAGSGVWAGPGPQEGANVTCDQYIVGLVPNYIAELPRDPNQESDLGEGFMYVTDATGSVYKAMVHGSVEKQFVTSYADEFARCPASNGSGHCGPGGPQNYVYAIYSKGTEWW